MRTVQLAAWFVVAAVIGCGDPTEDPDLHREVPCDAAWEAVSPAPEPLAACELPCADPENYIPATTADWECVNDRNGMCAAESIFEHGDVTGCCEVAGMGRGTGGDVRYVAQFAVCLRDI